MSCFGCFVNIMTFIQNLLAFSIVALRRSEEFDPAVMMLMAVPLDESRDPLPGVLNTLETLQLVVGTVFQGLEHRL